jgi:5-hydroxyisourate hydrolase-like protein (transthyretin family)
MGAAAAALCLASCVALAPALVRAQTPAPEVKEERSSSGVITGKVLDQENHQPLPNARVGIYRLDKAEWTSVAGMLSAADGTFRFVVTPGTYRIIFSYQSYATSVIDDITVRAGQTQEVPVTLTPKPLQIKGVDIKGTEARGSEASSLSKQKKAAYVSDAITSEQISKSTDSNAAEALQRVTGLSVVDGRYVYVRGLGERYSSTQVNGSSVGTPEPNKRVVPLDVFPSGALDNVVVQKSYTPDQDAEFGGGVVQLNTRDFVEGKIFTQSMTVGSSAHAFERGFLSGHGGRLDFLGFDDGTRAMPDLLVELAGDKRITQKSAFSTDGLSVEQIQALGQSFDKNWTPRSNGAPPNYAYAASYARGFRLFQRDLGVLASFSLNNNFVNESTIQNAYAGSSSNLTPLYEYEVEKSTAKVLGGVLGNLSMRLAPSQTVRLRTLYTRSAEDEARVAQGPNYNFGTDAFRVTRLGYVERGLLSNVLSGEHALGLWPGFMADWGLGYSEASRDEPSRRENTYESDGTGRLVLSRRNQVPMTRLFGEMDEYDRTARGNLTLPFHLGDREMKAKTGVSWRLRNRTSSFRRFGFELGREGASSLDLSLPPEELLVDENIKPGYFMIQENTRENDRYGARQELKAAYAMLDIQPVGHLRVIGGARVEDSRQSVEAKSPFVSNAPETDVFLKTQDVLPALNLAYALTDKMNLRAGYSKTVSRPELREMSAFDMYDYETGFTEVGNPGIVATPVLSYDSRWEMFLGPRELLSVSVFHKSMDRPIESVVLGSSGGYVLTPRNGSEGRVTGVELEARFGMVTVWDGLKRLFSLAAAPNALRHWGFNLNFTRVESTVHVPVSNDANGDPIYRTGPLGGQSSYALNGGLGFEGGGMEAALLYSAFGKRLAQVGAGQYPNVLPDIYEYPMKSVDMTLARKLGGGLRIKISAENLLDSETEFRQLDRVTRRSSPGRTLSLGLQLKQ